MKMLAWCVYILTRSQTLSQLLQASLETLIEPWGSSGPLHASTPEEGGREGGRERGKEGGKEGGREVRRQRGRKEGREEGRES